MIDFYSEVICPHIITFWCTNQSHDCLVRITKFVSPDCISFFCIEGIWSFYTLSNGGAFMAPDADSDDKWHLFNSMNGNGAQMSAEAAGISICLIEYSHHACRTECDAMTEHYYRLRDYALQHPESHAIFRIID